MIYIPIRSDAAEKLSRAIYQLSRPNSVRDPADVSTHYCEWIQHPTRPEVALVVLPDTDELPVHPNANGTLLEATLAPFVDAELTRAEFEGMMGTVRGKKGQKLNPASIISASWQPYVMDETTAKETGWIPERKK